MSLGLRGAYAGLAPRFAMASVVKSSIRLFPSQLSVRWIGSP